MDLSVSLSLSVCLFVSLCVPLGLYLLNLSVFVWMAVCLFQLVGVSRLSVGVCDCLCDSLSVVAF